MHIWLVESSIITVLRKASFLLQQRNSNGIAELHGNDLTNLTPRLKSLQHNTLQPENGTAHGICWQYNIVEQEQNKAITTCIFGWWKALLLQFCEKPVFSYNKGIDFI